MLVGSDELKSFMWPILDKIDTLVLQDLLNIQKHSRGSSDFCIVFLFTKTSLSPFPSPFPSLSPFPPPWNYLSPYSTNPLSVETLQRMILLFVENQQYFRIISHCLNMIVSVAFPSLLSPNKIQPWYLTFSFILTLFSSSLLTFILSFEICSKKPISNNCTILYKNSTLLIRFHFLQFLLLLYLSNQLPAI